MMRAIKGVAEMVSGTMAAVVPMEDPHNDPRKGNDGHHEG